MKHLIFIGVMFLLGSCSMENHYFSKRIPVLSEKNSPLEFFNREETAELSVLKQVEEQELTFELSQIIDSVEVIHPSENTDSLKNIAPMYEDPDPIQHNECRCFGKTLRFTGSTVAVIGVFAWFFGGATLGTIIIVLGLSMLLIGLIIKAYYARRV